MNKLLHANFRRMTRDRAFLFCSLALAVLSIAACLNQYREMQEYGFQVVFDKLFLGFALMVGPALAVFTSLFIGTEYAEGTIRNKLATGSTRVQVYLSNFVSCAVAGLLLDALIIVCVSAIGVPLFGGFQSPIREVVSLMLCGLLLTVCYGALFNMLAMLIPNRAVNAIVSLLLMVVLLIAAAGLLARLEEPEVWNAAEYVGGQFVFHETPNPRYLNDAQRAVYELGMDLLPGGQSIHISGMMANHPVRMAVLSVAETVLFNLAGLFFFRKKDLK